MNKVHARNVGGQIPCINVCLFVYTDDNVLLSYSHILAPVITSLQMLLNVFEHELDVLQMKIQKKQYVYGLRLNSLTVNYEKILKWSKSCRFLAKQFLSGR
jgi:hypothetical protein